MQLSTVLHHWRRNDPDRLALVMGDRRVTYGSLALRSVAFGRALLREYGSGITVCALLENCIEYPELYFGCAMSGNVLAPLNHRLTARELVPLLERAEPRVLVTSGQVMPEPVYDHCVAAGITVVSTSAGPDEWGVGYEDFVGTGQGDADVSPGDAPSDPDVPCLMFFTSGSTGRPKGVLHSQRNLMLGALTTQASTQVGYGAKALQVLPIGGINFVWVLTYLLAGMTIHVAARFEERAVLQVIEEHRIAHTVLAPIMLDMITREPEMVAEFDTRSLQTLGYGGSLVPERVLKRALVLFGPVVRQMYGQTEVSGLFTTKSADAHLEDLVSAGFPTIGTRLRIVRDGQVLPTGETGEIQAQVPFALLGYAGDVNLDDKIVNGWVRTGDAGYLDERGALVIQGRADDVVVTGAYNVMPREVETVLLGHKDVVDCVVVGVPDDVWGERVAALIVTPRDEGLKLELDAFCRGRLASPKRPRLWLFVDCIPRNLTGKVDRTATIALAMEAIKDT